MSGREARPWNHNIHYHDMVLQAVPADCGRALDVGCGQGMLARRLASGCRETVAIDADRATLDRAAAEGDAEGRVAFVEGDVMSYPFAASSFDLITAVATLHHLPLGAGLTRFRELLKPGGVLVVIGLYRLTTPIDYASAAVALPISRTLRLLRGSDNVGAPIREPIDTLAEIRSLCAGLLPGCDVQRRLFFRYSLLWRKPLTR